MVGSLPSKNYDFKFNKGAKEINKTLKQTSNHVNQYINIIDGRPDDFGNQQFDLLEKSIKSAVKALEKYEELNAEFKKKHKAIELNEILEEPIKFDETLNELTDALKTLSAKHQIFEKEAQKEDKYQKIANATLDAFDIIQHLVNEIEELEGLPSEIRATKSRGKETSKIERTVKDQFEKDVNEINNKLKQTSASVKKYIQNSNNDSNNYNKKQFEALTESIHSFSESLRSFNSELKRKKNDDESYKRAEIPNDFNENLKKLDGALDSLYATQNTIASKALEERHYKQIADDTVFASDIIQNLVFEMEELETLVPWIIKPLDLRNPEYRRGQKTEKATNEEFGQEDPEKRR